MLGYRSGSYWEFAPDDTLEVDENKGVTDADRAEDISD
jgi:hypothetical protein